MARRVAAAAETETVLIATKTYPTPSSGYVETTCVAAIGQDGALRRVFPVPFRLLDGDKQFARWQWVTAQFRLPSDDRRPESRRIEVGSIALGEKIPTGRGDWSDRMRWVEPHILPSFAALEARRQATGETLGFLRLSRLMRLDITPLPATERDWTEEDRAKLTRDLGQGDLFATGPTRPRPLLEKIPYHFHYRYEIETEGGTESLRHLITDWEAGVLYRNCHRSHGDGWEAPFRAKLETEFAQKNLVLMMGTQHRFPDQWLIIGLVYPPRRAATKAAQPSLDF